MASPGGAARCLESDGHTRCPDPAMRCCPQLHLARPFLDSPRLLTSTFHLLVSGSSAYLSLLPGLPPLALTTSRILMTSSLPLVHLSAAVGPLLGLPACTAWRLSSPDSQLFLAESSSVFCITPSPLLDPAPGTEMDSISVCRMTD